MVVQEDDGEQGSTVVKVVVNFVRKTRLDGVRESEDIAVSVSTDVEYPEWAEARARFLLSLAGVDHEKYDVV